MMRFLSNLQQNLTCLVIISSVFLGVSGCKSTPQVSPEVANEMLSQRSLGLAYIEEDKLDLALKAFTRICELAPHEPFGFANAGLVHFRLGDVAEAEKWLEKAVNVAPDHAPSRLMLAIINESEQRIDAAINILQGTLAKQPDHPQTLYRLAQILQNHDQPASKDSAAAYLSRVADLLPANLAVRLQLVETQLQNGKPNAALQHMELTRQILPAISDEALQTFQQSVLQMRDGNAQAALAGARMFHNLLRATPFYQAALSPAQGLAGVVTASPVDRFMYPVRNVVQGDTEAVLQIGFTEITEQSGLDAQAEFSLVQPADFDSDGSIDIYAATRTGERILYRSINGKFKAIPADPMFQHRGKDRSAEVADYDNDGFLDLLIVHSRGVALYHNDGKGRFSATNSQSGINPELAAHTAAFADFDLEGDLDLLLGTEETPALYRNNLDGTFLNVADEAGIAESAAQAVDAAYGDFDDDGDIDAIILSADGSHLQFDNLRQSYFSETGAETGLHGPAGATDLEAADFDNDGDLDLVIAGKKGHGIRLLTNDGGGNFTSDTRSDSLLSGFADEEINQSKLFDANNDGWLDMLICGSTQSALIYNTGSGTFRIKDDAFPLEGAGIFQAYSADTDIDGDLDILAIGSEGKLHVLRNDNGNSNNYLVIKLAGLRTGSSKNNFYGIGAKIEVKAGSLYQMRTMTSPTAHFGLGVLEKADVVRVLWSNGVAQNRFNPERNQTILENQVLKGSCPWLYTWNGKEYTFVTDVLWSSALGMPLGIMADGMGYAPPFASRDHFKIPAELLQAVDSEYKMQFTSELWETTYLDEASLMLVDHPDSVEIFVDEKFRPGPPEDFRIYAVSNPWPARKAIADNGRDVRHLLEQQDAKYLSPGPSDRFQGVTQRHSLVLDPGEAGASDRLWLFLQGWIFPADASINVNLDQSGTRVLSPQLQVRNRNGDWQTVIENIGFPKGKNKTVVVDLNGRFLSNNRELRIVSEMQIYWDRAFFADAVDAGPIRISSLKPAFAKLWQRGFSEVIRRGEDQPHIPLYNQVATDPKWRDLTGNYTRYGDVQPLLLDSDNRYVIMNAGDAVELTFGENAETHLPPGWTRDFVFYNVGWVKDGDLNTAHGQTVEPLPYHGMTSYPLPEDEAYPKNDASLKFLQQYNTRQVETEAFRNAIWEWRRR